MVSLVFDRSSQPPTDQRIAEVEQQLGVSLPPEFQSLLRTGGCRLSDENAMIDSAVFINNLFPLDEDGDTPLAEANLERWAYHDCLGEVMNHLLAFGDNDFGDFFFLGTSGEFLGKVFFWVHDMDPISRDEWKGISSFYLIANDFGAFLTMLKPFQD